MKTGTFTFTPAGTFDVEYLVIGGGGSGGTTNTTPYSEGSGGGGAGCIYREWNSRP